MNEAYADKFGLRPDDCVGTTVAEVAGASAYETLRPYIGTVLQGEAMNFEVEIPYEPIAARYMYCSRALEIDPPGAVECIRVATGPRWIACRNGNKCKQVPASRAR